jgi:hypothetical protein
MIITINEELGVVVAESKTKHGLSVCCPEDKFDLTRGIELARQRMVPKDVGASGLAYYGYSAVASREFLIRQREIHRRYLLGGEVVKLFHLE